MVLRLTAKRLDGDTRGERTSTVRKRGQDAHVNTAAAGGFRQPAGGAGRPAKSPNVQTFAMPK